MSTMAELCGNAAQGRGEVCGGGSFSIANQKEGGSMVDSPMVYKSKQFALHVIRVCQDVRKRTHDYALANQLERSGTSVGANIREAINGQSKADFIAKLQIALKECAESEYWLELMSECGHLTTSKLLDDCIELKKIIVKALKTAKSDEQQCVAFIKIGHFVLL